MKISVWFITAISIYLCLPVSAVIVDVPDLCPTIQEGIDLAKNGDTVLVHNGVFHENVVIRRKPIYLVSNYYFSGDTSDIVNTVIDGDSAGSVITVLDVPDSKVNIAGLTIKNGRAFRGGGIYMCDASLRIEHNNFIDNQAVSNQDSCGFGGAIYTVRNIWGLVYKTPVLISQNYFLQNKVIAHPFKEGYGGAIYINMTRYPLITENVFETNQATGLGGSGGAITIANTRATIARNIFFDNVADRGGAIYCYFNADSDINHNLIYDNYGGGICAIGMGDAVITNNTIVGNTWAGGILTADYIFPVITNNIVRDNDPYEVLIYEYGAYPVRYNNIAGGWTGNGNIDADPLFVDPENYDFNLQPLSRCIDTGEPYSPLDPDGSRADMGAYFYDQSVSIDEYPSIPQSARLLSNYPNPFNSSTTISFELAEPGLVRLDIYDILGRNIETLIDKRMSTGQHKVVFNAADLCSGIFFYRIQTGQYTQSNKMILLK